MARLARGGRSLLVAGAVLVAVVTAVLNLDTAVAFLTPVLVLAARRRRVDEAPFLYLAVFLANGASLLLPGSNLTNLIVLAACTSRARAPSPPHAPGLAGRLGPRDRRRGPAFPGAASDRRRPGTGGAPGPGRAPAWRRAAGGGGHGGPAGAAGPWWCSEAGLVTARRPVGAGSARAEVAPDGERARPGRALRAGRRPGDPRAALVGPGQPPGPRLVVGTAAVGAVASVVVNNLPAASLLAARPPPDPYALLVGLNLGPNLAVTGALSAVLWLQVAPGPGARPSVRPLHPARPGGGPGLDGRRPRRAGPAR